MVFVRVDDSDVESSESHPQHGVKGAGRDPERLGRRSPAGRQVTHHVLRLGLEILLLLGPILEPKSDKTDISDSGCLTR